jgi:hypothetical protein
MQPVAHVLQLSNDSLLLAGSYAVSIILDDRIDAT